MLLVLLVPLLLLALALALVVLALVVLVVLVVLVGVSSCILPDTPACAAALIQSSWKGFCSGLLLQRKQRSRLSNLQHKQDTRYHSEASRCDMLLAGAWLTVTEARAASSNLHGYREAVWLKAQHQVRHTTAMQRPAVAAAAA